MEESIKLFDREKYESNNDYKVVVDEILSTLTPREEKVVKLRYGLGYDKAHTLVEVGQMLDLEREAIRIIEAKAHRKLRHPSRMRKLNAVLEEN